MQTLTERANHTWALLWQAFEAPAEERVAQAEGPSPITPWLLLLVSPFIALAFLIFLPLVGFGMLFWLMFKPFYAWLVHTVAPDADVTADGNEPT